MVPAPARLPDSSAALPLALKAAVGTPVSSRVLPFDWKTRPRRLRGIHTEGANRGLIPRAACRRGSPIHSHPPPRRSRGDQTLRSPGFVDLWGRRLPARPAFGLHSSTTLPLCINAKQCPAATFQRRLIPSADGCQGVLLCFASTFSHTEFPPATGGGAGAGWVRENNTIPGRLLGRVY